MELENLRKIFQRAGELSGFTLNQLRSASPDAIGDTQAAGIQCSKFMERTGAATKEIRSEYIAQILEEEFGHLASDSEPV